METDQFNLPPTPLVDIAPEVETYVAQQIQTAIDKLNSEIHAHESCVSSRRAPGATAAAAAASGVEVTKVKASDPQQQPIHCGTEPYERAKLTQLRSSDAVAAAVYEELGTGTIFHARMGLWLTSHRFEHEPARYTAPFSESIYISAPVNYVTLSPTIRVYSIEFGTDKFDHLFQQGYTYYRKYNAARSDGKSDADALKAAVTYGRSTENLFFGYAVSGVYSNADLAANLAGLRFYQNLTSEIKIGDQPIGAKAKLVEGHWLRTETYFMKPDRQPISAISTPQEAIERRITPIPLPILRPFITEHLNEALNPSNYLFFLYPVVKSVIKKRACPEWRAAFPTATPQSLAARSAALTTWYGLDYGYKTTSRQPHLADLCFTDGRASVFE
jgi:hypothetical protein